MTLVELTAGDRARVERIDAEPALVQRLAELGLFEGEEFEFLGFAPLGDPFEIRIGNTRLSLRNWEGSCITVSKL